MLTDVFVPKAIIPDAATNQPAVLGMRREHGQSDFRKICCETGVITGASGSAFLSFGDTKVYVAVHGPRANQRGMSSGNFSDVGLLECDVRIATGDSHFLSSTSEPKISQQLRDALAPSVRLSSYPKSVISIHAVIVQSAGGELAAVISCASLALADASIEINDFVCAATIGLSKPQSRNGTMQSSMIVDPCKEEYDDLASVLTLSSMTSHKSVLTHLSVEGYLSVSEFAALMSLAKSGCSYLRTVMVNSLRQSASSR